MSYGLMPYAVDLDELRSVIGSGDEQLLNGLLRSDWRRELDELDDLFEGQSYNGRPLPPARDALRHLLMGEEYHPRAGALYGYCFKIVCETHRRTSSLPNGEWSAMRYEWFGTVQAELKKAGVDFDPASLVFGGAPVPLPDIGDFPLIGHVEAGEIPGLLARFDALDASTAAPQALRAIRQLQGWLSECARSGRSLVTYYH